MEIAKKGLRMLGVLMVIAGVVACKGGGDGDDGGGGAADAVSANGIWEGTFTEIGVGTFSVTGLIYNGRIIAISDSAGAIYDGTYTVTGNSISGNVTAYEINGGPFATATISGTVSEESAISVKFTTSYGSTGSMSLDFASIYNRDSSLSLTQGVWSYTSGAYSLAVAIDGDGSFFGQDSDGCVIGGNIGIIDTGRNLYDVDLLVESCGPLNGNYDGFAGLLDDISTNDTLQVAVSNENFLLLYPFSRQ